MRRPVIPALLLIPFVHTCRDLPTEPAVSGIESAAPALARALTPAISCTRSWASGVDGDWHFATNWSPSGIPKQGDNVCIAAAGSYTVTVNSDVHVNLLQVGGTGALPELLLRDDLVVEEGLLIESAGRMTIAGSQVLHVGSDDASLWQPRDVWFENHGIVDVEEACVCSPVSSWLFSDWKNYGWMFLEGSSALEVVLGGDFVNEGFIQTTGSGVTTIAGPDRQFRAGELIQRSGSISGSAAVVVTNMSSFTWEGGPLPARSSDPSESVVVIEEVEFVVFDDPDPYGVLTVRPFTGPQLKGSVGPNLRLIVEAALGSAMYVADAERFVNEGNIDVLLDGSFSLWLNASSAGRLEQRGTLHVTGAGTLSLKSLTEDVSVANTGTIRASGGSRIAVQRYSPGRVTNLDNRGDIVVEVGSTLDLEGSVFVSGAGSSQSGALLLGNSTLQGTGAVGDVETDRATLSPGPSAPTPGGNTAMGTLTLNSLDLDAATEVVMDVAGTTQGSHDVLRVTGAVDLGGTLVVQNHPSFAGGVCGLVVPLITDGTPNPTDRGSFDGLQGVSVGTGRAWRLHMPPGMLALSGYRPGPEPAYGSPSSFALREGGPPEVYQVCLGGGSPPTNDVTLSVVSAATQVTATPMTFAGDDWTLPRTVAVRAIDDAVVEGPHTDVLTHEVTSTDPAWNRVGVRTSDVTIRDNDGSADLTPILVSQEDGQFLGDTMNTRFQITNLGPTESTGSTFVSTSLVGLEFVNGTGANCSVDAAGVVTCEVGPIQSGGQVEITVSFEGVVVGLHASTWTVAGVQPDPDGGNDAVGYTQRVN